MKRIAALILSAVLLAASLSACGRKEDGIVKDSPTPTHTVEEDIVEPIESVLPSASPDHQRPSASPEA